MQHIIWVCLHLISQLVSWINEYSFGSSCIDDVKSMTELPGNKYILGGTVPCNDGNVSTIYDPSFSTLDIWLVCFDDTGIIWEHTYGTSGNDELKSIITDDDGNIMALGEIFIADFDVGVHIGARDIWLIKADATTGDIIWEKTYGYESNDMAEQIIADDTGNFYFIGKVSDNTGQVTEHFDMDDIWITHIDNDGNILWEKTIGGSQLDEGYSLALAADNGVVATGFTFSIDGNVMGDAEKNGFLFKLQGDSVLNIINQHDENSFEAYSGANHTVVMEWDVAPDEITIYDLSGKKLYSFQPPQVPHQNISIELPIPANQIQWLMVRATFWQSSSISKTVIFY